METTERNDVADTMVNEQPSVNNEVKTNASAGSGSGFGKVVMFGAVPGILLGSAGTVAAASVVSDDFDAVVEDFKNAASGYETASNSDEVVTEEVDIEETVAAEETVEMEDVMEEPEVQDVQEVAVDTLQVAGVEDSMSFGEAFAAARSQVGPAGVFEWRGNDYSTFTKEEWDSMDAAQRGDYMHKYYNTDMSEETVSVVEEVTAVEDVEGIDVHEVADNLTDRQDVTVTQLRDTVTVSSEEVIIVNEETEEVLTCDVVDVTVEHEVCDSHIVFGEVDGHEVMYSDLDSDGVADYMVIDANDNGIAEYEEIHDISGDGLDMDCIG